MHDTPSTPPSSDTTDRPRVSLEDSVTQQLMAAQGQLDSLHEQLTESQRLATIGTIAAVIAHEFNNLLTAVLGNAELAEMILPPGSEVLPLLADVRIGARRAAELSQQLLNYSIRGTRPSGPLDLSEAIRGVRDLLGVAVSRRCPLHIDLAEGLPLIAADESRIRQLLTSVVSNAGEAASDTGGAVTLRTRCVFHTPGEGPPIHGELARGWHVLVQIDDRGSGMSPEARRRVFEPFFSTKFPGRGLGLAAVLGIMLDHGGGIRVCSTEGCGTSVSMFFPPLDPAATGLGRPENAPAHDPDCRFCEPSGVVSDACAVARPPLPWCGLARTGWSSSVRSQSRRLKSQDTS